MTSNIQVGPFTFICNTDQISQAPSKAHQWPKQDLIKYAAFLNFSKNDITTQEDAFSWSFLRKMSLFIQTKNPNQCRIFHKKMMENHASLDLLISDLRTKIEKFEEWYEAYEPSLRNVKHCLHRETSNVDKQPTKIKSMLPDKHQKLYVENETFGEKLKQDFKPTDVDYPEENIQLPKPSFFESQKRTARPSFGFESFGQTDTSKNFNRHNDFDFFNKRSPSFLEQKQEEKPSSQEWMDCHNSFIYCLKKLNKLVGGSHQ